MRATAIIIAIAFVMAGSVATAQIPRTISYQGMILDGNNMPLQGSHQLNISIYTAPNNGVALFTESHTMTVTNGIFSVIIGSVNAVPVSMDFGAPYYLGVSVDGGTELQPRTPFASVPYALHAVLADGLTPGATGAVTSINGVEGDITLKGGGGTTVNKAGNVITISSSGAGGIGIQGVQALDGSMAITDPNGPVASIGVAEGGITTAKLGDGSVTTAKIGDGSVTLPKISKTGAQKGEVITFDGSDIIWSPVVGGGGLTLPYAGSTASPSTAFSITTTGTGRAGYFAITNASNSNPVLVADQAGLGNAILANITNANNIRPGILVQNGGKGLGGSFTNSSATNDIAALYATTAGTGPAVEGYINTTGTGVAGYFSIDNTQSRTDALVAQHAGSGDALHAIALNNGDAVYGLHTGAGGSAGNFRITSQSNAQAAIRCYTFGTGTALIADHGGASGNIAIFQSSSVAKARIDKTGKGFFNGGTQASGADVAEAFDVTGGRSGYEPGDVLVIATTADRTVEKSNEPYSYLVAGVYATKPGVLLTEHDIDESIDQMVPMGVVGVIPTKVTGENGAIHRGDLLVTSSTAGHAMRGDRDRVETGMVIGKALEDFDGTGGGVIKVLVNVK